MDEVTRVNHSALVLSENQTDENVLNLYHRIQPWLLSDIKGGLKSHLRRFFPKKGFFQVKKPDQPSNRFTIEEEVSTNNQAVGSNNFIFNVHLQKKSGQVDHDEELEQYRQHLKFFKDIERFHKSLKNSLTCLVSAHRKGGSFFEQHAR